MSNKYILIVILIFFRSVVFAGQLNVYIDTDFSEKYRASYSDSLKFATSQSTGCGLGVEYVFTGGKQYNITLGGRYALDREIQKQGVKNKYTMHTAYFQSSNELVSELLFLGLEINYSFHRGDAAYADYAKLSGDWGYGIFLNGKINQFMLKAGYRAIRGKLQNVWGDKLDIISEGLFVEPGFVINF